MTSEQWLQSRGFKLRFNGGASYWQHGRFTAYCYRDDALELVWRANDLDLNACAYGASAPEAFAALRALIAAALAEVPE